MAVPVQKYRLEVTEDDNKSPEDFDESAEQQHPPLPKMRISTKQFSKGFKGSFEPKPIKKDFSKHPYWRNKPLLKCHYCPFKSYFMAGYKRHIMVHEKTPKVAQTELRCKYCTYTFMDRSAFMTHMNSHNEGSTFGKFKCPLCSYSSGRRSTLTNHMAASHDLNSKGQPIPMDSFWCQDCDFTCAGEPTLDKHVEDHHPDRMAAYKPRYKCTICEFNTTYRFVLDRHKRGHMPPGQSYACMVCGIKMADEDSYQKHMNKHKEHGTSKPAPDVKPALDVKPTKKPVDKYTCDICGYRNPSPKQVARHRLVHSSVKAYPCPYCPSRFTYKYNMGVHVENVHKKSKAIAYALADSLKAESNRDLVSNTTSKDAPKNVATICILKQDSLSHLKANLENSLTYGCSLCSFTFGLRAEAKFHCELAHRDRLPMKFECSICNTDTKFFSEMVRHLRKHQGRKTEPVEGREFDGQSSVGQQKLFVCDHCDLKFDSKKEYKRHKRSVHYTSGTLFKCSKCNYTSLDRSEVTRHLKESHDRGGKSM